ncbi:MAG: vanadium-dependent haloperoxidase [Candidatus Methylacidiphilales bacterium]
MPPPPDIRSQSTGAEMTELYWMALLRDTSAHTIMDGKNAMVKDAATEINQQYRNAIGAEGVLYPGIDLPGADGVMDDITHRNLFRVGLPGEERGPLISQFFVRDIPYGSQKIDPRVNPYTKGKNYLIKFKDWYEAQKTGKGADGFAYPKANEDSPEYFEDQGDLQRYIATPRDLARFVHKDALHQAYFNAAILLLAGEARWTPGNPYSKDPREAGFGTFGGPHILSLVSEVATRALKIVWNQKWRVYLRLRPEAYAGLVHVQNIGVGGQQRHYGLPRFVAETKAASQVRMLNAGCKDGEDTFLLPMAFSSGSPIHPAYGAGHACVAGACVTVLKAFFDMDCKDCKKPTPAPIESLTERSTPFGKKAPWTLYVTDDSKCNRIILKDTDGMTIEGELNKLAANVAMGRSMGGVHWRTDNTRSLLLGEALAAGILAEITTDSVDTVKNSSENFIRRPKFVFRTFSRGADGKPRNVEIENGRVFVDNKRVEPLSSL